MITASLRERADTAMPPALDWSRFAQLPGDPKRNWEILCYGLVDWNYRPLGVLSGQRQQPGVEFHLKVATTGALGEPGRWWGWQCKWYGTPQPRILGKARRDDIEASIATTHKYLPVMTDWVLWLPEKLSSGDIEWFEGLSSPMQLHRWHDEDVEIRLGGDVSILRSTFFGELVARPESLAEAFEASLGPVRRRWDPAVHVSVAVERELRRALVEPGSWDRFREHGDRLLARAAEIEAQLDMMSASSRAAAETLVEDLQSLAAQLTAVADGADDGDPGGAVRACRQPVLLALDPWPMRQLATRLRSRRHPAALAVTAAEADRVDAVRLMSRAADNVSALAYAVVADAGQGKSFLSAQLAEATDTRPAGVLMLGIDLAAGHDLDDLACKVPVLGASSFFDLVATVDAAGARAGRRLPIVVDGLNESESPKAWESILARAKPVLDRFPNVLFVVTLRASIAEDVLPEYMERVDLSGFEQDVDEAVNAYFDYYKINPGAVRLPLRQFTHPLFLRLYCESTNPSREHVVGPAALPPSPVAVYRRYREVAADRLRRTLSLAPGFVEDALDKVALALWEAGTRSLPFEQVKTLVGDTPKEWDTSLAKALEEEGLIWRSHTPKSDDQRSVVLFDAFAGFLIGDALTRSRPADEILEEIRSGRWDTKLFALPADEGDDAKPHELASDIRFAMVDTLPRHTNSHLWQEAPESLRGFAVGALLFTDPVLLDDESISQVEIRLRAMKPPRSYYQSLHAFDRLEELLDAEGHPLNADFTGQVLALLSMAHRDRLWSEWLRERYETITSELAASEAQLRAGDLSAESARLRAVWTSWLLTSTVARVRDLATKWLYWYGRSYPAELFNLTLAAAHYNDPYLLERLTGASYGVVMAAYGLRNPLGPALNTYLEGVLACFVGDDATAPTTNHVVRDHLSGTVTLASIANAAAVPDAIASGVVAFASPPPLTPIADGTEAADVADATLHTDFVNYTMGRVFDDRVNYQSNHARHRALVAAVRARILNLGWNGDTFDELDSSISENRYRPHSRQPKDTERYGKKYGWISFHEEFGRLVAENPAEMNYTTRLPETGPDMSFPEPPPTVPHPPSLSLFDDRLDEDWVRNGEVVLPSAALPTVEIDGRSMVTIDARISADDPSTLRKVWICIRTVLVDTSLSAQAVGAIERASSPGSALLSDPVDHYLYAGEIPWSAEFAKDMDYEHQLRGVGDDTIVEGLTHGYAYEGSTDDWIEAVSGTTIAAATLWSRLDLRLQPQSFDGTDQLGQRLVAARVTREPGNHSSVLYVDEESLRAYATERGKAIVRVVWGERQIETDWGNMPDWYEQARRERADGWRFVEII